LFCIISFGVRLNKCLLQHNFIIVKIQNFLQKVLKSSPYQKHFEFAIIHCQLLSMFLFLNELVNSDGLYLLGYGEVVGTM
jgi:hypothetical protein